MKPEKPYPEFPLFAHSCGSWAKKIKGKMSYFGPWADPAGAMAKYESLVASAAPKVTPPAVVPASVAKPTPDFPLFAHSNGQWAKKIRGKVHYFGTDAQVALDKYLAEKDALLAGRRPQVATSGLTVGGLVDHFLTHTEARTKDTSGNVKALAPRTHEDYKTVMAVVVRVFGRARLVEDLGPDDFAKLRATYAKTHGPVALYHDITRVRVLFNYGDRQFNVKPRYGASFDKPTRSVLRREKASRPEKFFRAKEIRKMLAKASVPLKAMILLGINCGFGNGDCAAIKLTDLNLDRGWHYLPRPKTGIFRNCPLWPETVAALKAAIMARPKPRDPANADRVFITSRGLTWEKTQDDNPISKEMAKLLKSIGCHKQGRNFYALRHTFQTVGDGSGQKVAVSYIMGHSQKGLDKDDDDDQMADVYRERVSKRNLIIALKYVRKWLFKRTALPQEPKPLDKSA